MSQGHGLGFFSSSHNLIEKGLYVLQDHYAARCPGKDQQSLIRFV